MYDNYLTLKQAAKLLSVHWQTIRNYIHSGQLPYLKFGNSYRINKNDLDVYFSKKKQPDKTPTLEVERRFILKRGNNVENKLRALGAKLVNHTHIIDHWFVNKNIKSMEENLAFVESKLGFSLRIREAIDIYSNRTTYTLEIKKNVTGKSHGDCIEQETVIQNYEETAAILNLMNLKKIIALDKERFVYSLNGIKYVFDNIKGFGSGLEIEIKSQLSIADAEKLIFEAAKKLGLSSKEKVDKSITYLVLVKNADFS